MATTRESVRCVIFGAPKKLGQGMLPTYKDVMKHYIFVREGLKVLQNKKHPAVGDVIDVVVLDIQNIWSKTGIPTVSNKRVKDKLKAYHDKYMVLQKPYQARKETESYKSKVETFVVESDALFDICTCKCNEYCSCEKSNKVPTKEICFLQDQRGVRKMMMGGIDKLETRRLEKYHDRKTKDYVSQKKRRQAATTSDDYSCRVESIPEDMNDFEQSESDSENFTFPDEKENGKRQKIQMRTKLPALAAACDRHGVSDRAAAALASAVLQDVGMITSDDMSKVVDRSKIRRERDTNRTSLQQSASVSIPGIYFDGRKDETVYNELQADGKYHRITIREEHVSIVSEPESCYFSHVTPENGTSKGLAKAITDCLEKKQVETDTICAVGCDGTNVNTGHIKGVVRLLEESLQRPLQWFICQLHANELPLRHLFKHLDGSTTGPNGFAGPIGKSLQKCESAPIIKFTPIQGDFPEVDSKELSTDQKYLYEMCQAVSSGICPADLGLRQPGIMDHSRWLTTANRLLRLYVSDKHPSASLIAVVTFIMRVYAPMWFVIKTSPSCQDGARHVYQTISKSRYLPSELKAVVDNVVNRNAYFGHHENILLSMLTDERAHVRQLGVQRILNARKRKQPSGVRRFKIPKLNFEARDYIDLINWEDVVISEPPVTMDIDDEILKQITHSSPSDSPVLTFPHFPCHTQAVERCVKLVTESSTAVCGYNRRDGFIRARNEARKNMPVYETKRDHKVV